MLRAVLLLLSALPPLMLAAVLSPLLSGTTAEPEHTLEFTQCCARKERQHWQSDMCNVPD